jgi:hypothetical protein
MQFKQTTIQDALSLVEQWYTYANTIQIESDKAWSLKMKKLSCCPKDKKLLFELFNALFRTSDNKKLASLIDDLIQTYGIGDYFTPSQKAFFWLFKHSTKHTPDFSVPLIMDYIKQECSSFLTNSALLDEYLDKKRVQETPVHTTLLMHDALNEYESKKNVEKYIQTLAKENIESLSINLLAIHPKINFICQNSCMQSLEHKLSMLFRKTLQYKQKSGIKKIYLEIPNKRFSHSILAAFEQVVLKEEFKHLNIGIGFCIDNMDVLPFLKYLNAIALKRSDDGAKGIEIKLVKTRNNKKVIRYFHEVLLYMFQEKQSLALSLVLNTHNLFDMALAYSLAKKSNQLHALTFQMDKGMHLSYRSAISTLSQKVWVNSCVVDFDEFEKGIPYLLNRLNQCSKRNNQYDIQKQSFLKYVAQEYTLCTQDFHDNDNTFFVYSSHNAKELLFVSKLCNKVKLVEAVIQKIAYLEPNNSFLSFELFIEEEELLVEELKITLGKTVEDFFACNFGVGNFSSAKLSTGQKNWCIVISSSSLEVVIKLNVTNNLAYAMRVCSTIEEKFDCSIHTLNKQEFKQLNMILQKNH